MYYSTKCWGSLKELFSLLWLTCSDNLLGVRLLILICWNKLLFLCECQQLIHRFRIVFYLHTFPVYYIWNGIFETWNAIFPCWQDGMHFLQIELLFYCFILRGQFIAKCACKMSLQNLLFLQIRKNFSTSSVTLNMYLRINRCKWLRVVIFYHSIIYFLSIIWHNPPS